MLVCGGQLTPSWSLSARDGVYLPTERYQNNASACCKRIEKLHWLPNPTLIWWALKTKMPSDFQLKISFCHFLSNITKN